IQAMMAMMWNAFSHSYMSSGPAQARQHALDVCDGRLRQDAVSQVEDKRALREYLENAVDRAVERSAAGDQRQRIEVALHRYAPLDLVPHKYRIDGRIETHGVDRHVLHVAQQCAADPARKSDDPGRRHLRTHLRGDALRGLDAPPLQFLQW